jgi:hypothetical protein
MSGASTTFRLTEFVLAISRPICERSYDHNPLVKGNVPTSVISLAPFEMKRLRPVRARNLIFSGNAILEHHFCFI